MTVALRASWTCCDYFFKSQLMFFFEELYTFKPGKIKFISVTASFYLEARVGLGLQSCSDQDFPSLHPYLVLLKTQI